MPPEAVRVLADALAEDQRARVGGQDGVARLLIGQPDVGAGIAGAPGGTLRVGVTRRGVRLVAEVEADHGGVARVPFGQRDPVVHPVLAGVGARVPQAVGLGGLPGLGAVVVQDDLETLLARVGDDLVEDLQGVETLEVGVDRAGGVIEAEVLRDDRGLHHLVGERDPDRVVAQVPDVVDDRVVVLRPEAVRDLVGSLEAVPVDAGDPDRVPARVEDLVAAGVPVAGSGARGWCGGCGGPGGAGGGRAGGGGAGDRACPGGAAGD